MFCISCVTKPAIAKWTRNSTSEWVTITRCVCVSASNQTFPMTFKDLLGKFDDKTDKHFSLIQLIPVNQLWLSLHRIARRHTNVQKATANSIKIWWRRIWLSISKTMYQEFRFRTHFRNCVDGRGVQNNRVFCPAYERNMNSTEKMSNWPSWFFSNGKCDCLNTHKGWRQQQ